VGRRDPVRQSLAKQQTGIDELLEAVLLQSEILDLDANPRRPAEGLVIESRLDVGRGPVATVLVQEGTLRPGDTVVVGAHWGRVRAMQDERGRMVKSAPPSIPVEITGLDGVPEAGETLYAVTDEKSARTISSHFLDSKRQSALVKTAAAPADLGSLAERLDAGKLKELKLIVKADVQGSVEALQQALGKLSTPEVTIRLVHAAVGGINENDINWPRHRRVAHMSSASACVPRCGPCNWPSRWASRCSPSTSSTKP
jgi:translation initiation factor IF-2